VKPGKPLKRTTPLARGAGIKRGKGIKQGRSPRALGVAVLWHAAKVLAYVRCGGLCERCGLVVAFEMCQGHHRRARTYGPHTVTNCLILHDVCHAQIHNHPTASRAAGWIVASTRDPADVPVLLPSGRRVFFAADGTYLEEAA
jgi:hypothetical protein